MAIADSLIKSFFESKEAAATSTGMADAARKMGESMRKQIDDMAIREMNERSSRYGITEIVLHYVEEAIAANRGLIVARIVLSERLYHSVIRELSPSTTILHSEAGGHDWFELRGIRIERGNDGRSPDSFAERGMIFFHGDKVCQFAVSEYDLMMQPQGGIFKNEYKERSFDELMGEVKQIAGG